MSIADELKELQDLKERGELTQEEFDFRKANVLADVDAPPTVSSPAVSIDSEDRIELVAGAISREIPGAKPARPMVSLVVIAVAVVAGLALVVALALG